MAASPRSTPEASATARISVMQATSSARVSGTLRMAPMGARVAAPTVPKGSMKRNFSQIARSIRSGSTGCNPAPVSASANRANCARAGASGGVCVRGPNSSTGVTAACLMCPGPASSAMTRASPSITCASPRTLANWAAASTPFCSGITAVFGPMSGRSVGAIASIWVDLTVTSTTSTTPTEAMSSVTFTVGRRRSPSQLSSTSPEARMVASVEPRAMKMTSCPDCRRRAPTVPPRAPAPMIAIRISANVAACAGVG